MTKIFRTINTYIRADNLLIALEKKNQNNSWLAEQLGVSKTHLSSILWSKAPVSSKLRARLLEVFKNRLKWDDIFWIRRVGDEQDDEARQ